MPLADASVGQEVVLASIAGGRRLLHRLAEMGLTPGAKFRIVANHGPFIVQVKDMRLVLGRGMVHRLCVRPA